MAKFKVGDRVKYINLNGNTIKYGEVGTVLQGGLTSPRIQWDSGDEWVVYYGDLQLVREVDSVILFEKSSFASWDDSVEFTPTELPKIDRFTFNYEDEYGMNISHGFSSAEFEYNLLDVVANFVLYLKGIGYDDEQIGEYIKMGSL